MLVLCGYCVGIVWVLCEYCVGVCRCYVSTVWVLIGCCVSFLGVQLKLRVISSKFVNHLSHRIQVFFSRPVGNGLDPLLAVSCKLLDASC